MRVYIIEHQTKDCCGWSGKISQEGYSTLEAAQNFIEKRPGNPQKSSSMWYDVSDTERYLIHDILIK